MLPVLPWAPFALGPLSSEGETPPPTPPPPADAEPGAVFGYGAPSEEQDNQGAFGQGFGSPETLDETTPSNFGFGDPDGGALTPVYMPGVPAGSARYPDDGSSILAVVGPWSGSPLSFRVRVRHGITGAVYPSDPTKSLLGLPGERAGAGVDLQPLADGTLRFALCPLPLGPYDLLVSVGPSFSGAPIEVPDLFRVVYRHLCRESWNIRHKFPEHWHGAGPRSLQTEPVPAKNRTFPQQLLRSLTAAIGEQIQLTGGKAVTRTTLDLEDGATEIEVETTLGFLTEGGTVFVGEREYRYTSVDDTHFLGCTPKFVYDSLALPPGTMVVSKPADWVPEE